jgi:hypothetical protein
MRHYLIDRRFYTVMSSREKQMRYLASIIGIVFIPFFIYKYSMLSDYHKYPGVIKGFETVYARYPGYKSRGGYEPRRIPVVEYYSEKDTSVYSEGTLNYFSSYDQDQKITVLERKDNPYKTCIYSFWYYYMPIPELILLLLTSFIFFAICSVYILKIEIK